MTLDPDQLLLDGRSLAQARRDTRATRRRQQLDGWLSALDEPRTVAELACAWWPEVGDPRGWEVGRYPCGHIAAARYRVGVLVRCGLAVVGSGCLPHRHQEGVVVMRARCKRGGGA